MRHRITGALILCTLFAGVAQAQLPVTDGLEAWLDAGDDDTLYTDEFFDEKIRPGGTVGGWIDKSENGWEVWGVLSGDGLEAYPTHVPDAINGKPALRFSGADRQGMIFEEDFFLDREYTAFIVNQYVGPTRGRTLQSTTTNWLMGMWAGNVAHYAEGWVSSSSSRAQDGAYLASAVGTLDESRFWANVGNPDDRSDTDFNREQTVNNGPLGVPGNLGLVGGWDAGGFPGEVSDVDIAEVVLYNRALSDEEHLEMRNYLADKYAIEPLWPPPRTMNVILGKVGGYTGGDPGEGLDFEGDFAYAVNVGGPEENDLFEPLTVGDAVFTDGSEALGTDGVFITDANEINPWGAKPEFGDTDNDNNLEIVSNSIRWNGRGPEALQINVDVEEGQAYRLQMLFHEQCCDRGWDITIEDELAVDDFNPSQGSDEPELVLQEGIANLAKGAFWSHDFVAGDDELNIIFGGEDASAPDNNPILDGFTLELLDEIVVEPILGDCNDDKLVNKDDLPCITTLDERDAVLASIPSLPGDLDGDGDVDFPDFLKLAANFNKPGRYVDGNVNMVDDINFPDFLALAANYNKTPADALSAVPEPASASLLGLALLGLAGLRRRRG